MNYRTNVNHKTPNPSTILHRTNIVHVGIEIVIEIFKTSYNKTIKIFKLMTTRLYNNSTI